MVDTGARLEIKEGKVNFEGSPRVLNPYDEFAVEEAVQIREKQPDTEITLITLGPENFKDTLRKGLAMGADQAVHLLDPAFEDLDSLGIARALCLAIKTMNYDLVLCGRQAVDDDMAQVGPSLAALLDIPCVTVITELNFTDDFTKATVTRQIEGGSEIIETSLPALFTCQKGLNEPRLPSLKGIMAAKKKKVTTLSATEIGFDPAAMGEAVNKTEQIELSLPPSRKKGVILEGSVAEISSELASTLRNEVKVI